LLANLKAKKNLQVSFCNSGDRFIEKEVDENDAFLGPGYYEYKAFVDEKKPQTKSVTVPKVITIISYSIGKTI
jgi:hypothetical protein